MEQRILTKLRELGLNSYETKLWVALLSRGVSTAGQLSDVANVPRSRSYDVLESLRKKGFVSVKHGKPISYKAVAPEEVIRTIKTKVKKRTEGELKLIEDLKKKSLFKELETIHKQSLEFREPNELVCYLKNKTNIKNQIQYMVKNAKEFVYISETENGLESNVDFLTKTLPILGKGGVDVRVMVGEGDTLEGARLRNINIKKAGVLSRFYIVDGNAMLFMLFNDSCAGILVNTKPFIKSIIRLFNKQWVNSNFLE